MRQTEQETVYQQTDRQRNIKEGKQEDWTNVREITLPLGMGICQSLEEETNFCQC